MKSEVIKLIEGRDDVTLTTYILDDSPEMTQGKARPAVLICPGGAYLCCSDREGEPIAMAFPRQGYNAFVLRYSSAYDGSKPYWETDFAHQAINPDKLHPQPMREIGLAFACINEHRREWQVDAKRIAICGFSAGAHNCAMYSTHWSKPVITDFVGVDKEVLRPAACILGYPLTDYIYMYEATKKDSAGAFEFFSVSNRLMLGEDWEDEAKLLDMSPARLVDEDVPPTFIWSTSKDELVPVAHSTLYATSLAEAGIPFELHIVQDGGHGMALCDQSTSCQDAYDIQTNKDAKAWIDLAAAWLEKYFAIYETK